MGSINPGPDFDAILLGAGLSGLCTLHHLRARFPSWRIRVLEAGDDVGGTWHFNRYPGARFDSETVTYQFSWDEELLREWDWKETFASQPDTLAYIHRVVEKHDLRRDIQLNTRIRSAEWQDAERTWKFEDQAGRIYTSRFFVGCVGVLSAPTVPAIPGIESFTGQALHTSQWPRDLDPERDLAGKRVGVIGTGATGIQTITALSQQPSLASLTVFQRTANWAAPLRNQPIPASDLPRLKASYPSIFSRCATTPNGFLHSSDPRRTFDATPAERLALWEAQYAAPGFGKWIGVFRDAYTDRAANDVYSEFIAAKIRGRVRDPETAAALVPTSHGFGTRRVPLESGYFEAFNRENVRLVDLRKTGAIERVTARGVRTGDGEEHGIDVLVFATGFDAITGAWNNIDVRGRNGKRLMGLSSDEDGGAGAVWKDHVPHTYMGLMVPDMPNMFMVLGPHQPFGNVPRQIEHAVDVVVGLLGFLDEQGIAYAEPTQEAADEWYRHVVECGKGLLSNEVDSWMTGVNANVKGKTGRSVARYSGHVVEYRRRCETARVEGWKDLMFDPDQAEKTGKPEMDGVNLKNHSTSVGVDVGLVSVEKALPILNKGMNEAVKVHAQVEC